MPGKVVSHMTMSLDGFIADPKDNVGELFEWYSSGDVDMPSASSSVSFKVDQSNVDPLRKLIGCSGAIVSGRRLFDITRGWHDQHPAGVPVVVVTHQPPAEAATRWPRTTFLPKVDLAIKKARRIAGEKDVCIASASIAQQALALGLVDEVRVTMVPVLFGEGIRYFSSSTGKHVLLEDPTVTEGRRALHLTYAVRR